ncbi:serine hydrolase domain-containing protein [Planctomicrobium piriforme]|uniref:CubicO group peptidase, beta-lactamase class C family n=1 Tax=Planctomicrobium piriforme TaxID=1576369 RepID=A0A1I3R8S3_9PLAN|nr:serine hydrolase domain-containing protein [Planctomicrobium piriforme]SFJ42162.1 CubicO group peptidase, beta-lactamase class C family [Planctomicrobium piriforme]
MMPSPFPAFVTSLPTDCRSIFTARWWCLLLGAVVPLLAISATSAAGGELEDKLAAVCKSQDVPGIIAASVGPDGVIESAAAGVRKRGSDDAVTRGDQFALGSNSKSFTATLAAVLVDENAIDWSTTISEVWPDQTVHAKFKKVTLEQLLAHTGGLQCDLPNGAEWAKFFDERFTPEQERTRMCRLVLAKPPKGTVGKHVYSNLGYVVAAAMLEERGKKPFEQLMQERIFGPLGMTNTEFYSAKDLKNTKAPLLWGHQSGGGPIKPGEPGSENPTVYAGCGTIRTTIDDWAKYIGWHLNESAGPVLKRDETLRHLHEGVADRGAPGQSYGFGWIHFQSSFGRTLQHAGNNTNQFSLVWVMPETKRATLVITNTGQEQAFAACDAATAILMKSPAFQ